jgi:hypothetical protein
MWKYSDICGIGSVKMKRCLSLLLVLALFCGMLIGCGKQEPSQQEDPNAALYDENIGGWRIWYNGRRNSNEFIGEAFMPGDLTAEDFG